MREVITLQLAVKPEPLPVMPNPRLRMYRAVIITGTRYGRTDFERLMNDWVLTHGRPEMVVVGDATGVDEQAAIWALNEGIAIQRVLANPKRGKAMFHDRNQRMVNEGNPATDALIAFPASKAKSLGTWMTYNMGRRRGLKCFEL